MARLEESEVLASNVGLFEYLLGSWQNTYRVIANLTGAKGSGLDPTVRETRVSSLREAQSLLVSYMGLSLQVPEMFPAQGECGQKILVDALLAGEEESQQNAEYVPELLQQMAGRFAGDGLPEVLSAIVYELGMRSLNSANRSILQPGFRQVLEALDGLLRIGEMAQAFCRMPIFDPEECHGRSMQTGTAVGVFMGLSGFPASDLAITQSYYLDAPQRNHADREALHNGIRSTTQYLQGALFQVWDRLVRSGKQERLLTLQYTLRTLATNALRAGMQADPIKVVDDGFADNLASVWLKLSEPFTNDSQLKRLDRVDPDWVAVRAMQKNTGGGLDDAQGHVSTYWTELTRVNADQALVEEYLKKSVADASAGGFIGDCFFTTANALHLGPVATISQYVEKLQTLSRFERRTESMQANPETLPPAQRASLPALVERWERQLQMLKREKLALDAQVLDPRRLCNILVFYRFAMCFLLRQMDEQGAFPQQDFRLPAETDREAANNGPDKWRMLPEFLVEDSIEFVVFVATYAPDTLVDGAAQVGINDRGLRTFDDILPLFAVAFLARPGYIRNPHLKAKLVDALHILTYRDPREDDDYVDTLGGNLPGNLRLHPAIYRFTQALDDCRYARQYLVPALLRLYVDIETTGSSSQFYEKFGTRYRIARTLRSLWARGKGYVEVTRRFFMQAYDDTRDGVATTGDLRRDRQVVEEFVARLMTDTTYLLDESLSKLAIIRDLERQSESKTEEEAGEAAERLQEAERLAQSNVSLAHETVHMLAFLSKLVPQPFLAGEVLGRLTGMLNYNLKQLAGPKCSNLRVRDMQHRFSFNPRVLLSELTSVYLHLGLSTQGPEASRFVSCVVEDSRSFSVQLLEEAYGILERRSLKSAESLARFRTFIGHCQDARVDTQMTEFLEDRAPDKYLDPLMATLISEPVRLPTSDNVMDLAAIKGQLLGDPRDPFNRAPLTVDMLEPMPELKAEIDQWKAQIIKEYRKGL